MKKRFAAVLSCILVMLSVLCPFQTAFAKAPVSAVLEKTIPESTVSVLPAKQSYQEALIPLDENRQEVLEEIMCDYISEDVTALIEEGTDYSVSDWMFSGGATYVFFNENISGYTDYHVCGYAPAANGYVYFKLTAEQPFTQAQVAQYLQTLQGPTAGTKI